METAVLVLMVVVILVLLMVLFAFAQGRSELRTGPVPDTAVAKAGPDGAGWPGVGERRRAVSRLVEGYCVKDRAMVEMQSPEPVALRSGRLATVGVCPRCGTTIYKIEKTPAVVKAGAHVREERDRIRHGRREMA